jgi:hypothetical protein
MLFPVQQWLPDQPRLNNPGDIQALNVVPSSGGYEPFPLMTQAATGTTGQIYGATYARDNANNSYIYAGDVSALYTVGGGSLNAVTRVSASGAYATETDNGWEFVQWGQTVIGVNGREADYPQEISLGAATFHNLPGAFPASHIAIINNFVVLGNISDSGAQVQRVRWSGLNNSHDWSLSAEASTLADFQDIVGNGGWLQKITSGEQGGYVFMEREIWSMVFVGSPLVFQFTKLIDNVGAYASNAVVYYENHVYFLAQDGFKLFDGSNITDIGQGRVDQFFISDLDTNYLGSIRGMIVPEKKIVMWAYPGSGHSGSKCNKIICYSYAFDKWSLIEIPDAYSSNIDIVVTASTPGYTLDGLDSVSTNLDLLPFSLDSREWTGGQLVMSAYVNGVLYYFNGTPMDATVEVGETNLMAKLPMLPYQQPKKSLVANRAQINTIFPLVEGMQSLSSVSVSVNYRDNQAETLIAGMALSPDSAGKIDSRLQARYASFVIQTSGNFIQIQGVDVDFVNAGRR